LSSRNCFLLSLVVAPLLSTLALADSAPVSATFLHSSASSVYGGAQTYPDNFSIKAGNATPLLFSAFNNQPSTSAEGDVGSGLILGREMLGKGVAGYNSGFAFQDGKATTDRGQFQWKVETAFRRPGTPTATPEPGSLMLLSTGLIGIAGVLRRKLRS
jgi:hypothetical protein